jgi:hypothetical protein
MPCGAGTPIIQYRLHFDMFDGTASRRIQLFVQSFRYVCWHWHYGSWQPLPSWPQLVGYCDTYAKLFRAITISLNVARATSRLTWLQYRIFYRVTLHERLPGTSTHMTAPPPASRRENLRCAKRRVCVGACGSLFSFLGGVVVVSSKGIRFFKFAILATDGVLLLNVIESASVR